MFCEFLSGKTKSTVYFGPDTLEFTFALDFSISKVSFTVIIHIQSIRDFTNNDISHFKLDSCTNFSLTW